MSEWIQMQWPSQLRWLHNCWNATNECWILMKNVLSMGIIVFTHACRLSSPGNSWMTVVGWFLQMKVKKQSRKQRGLMLSDKKFHFSWLWRPTWALSSSLIWLSDWWVLDKNWIYPLISRLITELVDGAICDFVSVLYRWEAHFFIMFSYCEWNGNDGQASFCIFKVTDCVLPHCQCECTLLAGINYIWLQTGDKFPMLCAEAD